MRGRKEGALRRLNEHLEGVSSGACKTTASSRHSGGGDSATRLLTHPTHPTPPRQVFVANPNKTRPVVEILYNNKDKLLKYLDDFHNDRGERLGVWQVV